MRDKTREIVAEFFEGDDAAFVAGTFDGVLSGTMDTTGALAGLPHDYREGFRYGKYVLALENPELFSRILTSGSEMTFPEVVGTVDLMRGVRFDEDEIEMEDA